jgi:hypothetical protein
MKKSGEREEFSLLMQKPPNGGFFLKNYAL